MDDGIRTFVLGYIQRRGKLPKGADLDRFDYVRAGLIDSIGVMRFAAEIEARFHVALDASDFLSPDFTTIQGLIGLISAKLADNP